MALGVGFRVAGPPCLLKKQIDGTTACSWCCMRWPCARDLERLGSMRRLKPLHTRAHNLQLAVSSRQVGEQRALLTQVTEALALQREATSLTQRLGDERAVELAKQLETVRRQWGWVFWEGGWRGGCKPCADEGTEC